MASRIFWRPRLIPLPWRSLFHFLAGTKNRSCCIGLIDAATNFTFNRASSGMRVTREKESFGYKQLAQNNFESEKKHEGRLSWKKSSFFLGFQLLPSCGEFEWKRYWAMHFCRSATVDKLPPFSRSVFVDREHFLVNLCHFRASIFRLPFAFPHGEKTKTMQSQ